MSGDYAVVLQGKEAGRCTVSRQGLYYILEARCDLPKDGVYRLLLMSRDNTVRLGIPVPEGESFLLQTRIPAQKFPQGEFSFALQKKEEQTFVPLQQGKPFPYLHKLSGARLGCQKGQLGVWFPQN